MGIIGVPTRDILLSWVQRIFSSDFFETSRVRQAYCWFEVGIELL